MTLSACGGGGGGGGGVSVAPVQCGMPNSERVPEIRSDCICNSGYVASADGGSCIRDPSAFRFGEDAEYRNNYGLNAIKAAAAYRGGYFGQNVTVGVVDSGVRVTHREFFGNIAPGRDLVFPNNPMSDPHGHGTRVAGVIAARRNGREMHGVAPLARIMPLKIGDDKGSLTGNWREAARWAYDNHRVQIINNSFGEDSTLIGDYNGTIYKVEVPFLPGLSNFNSWQGQARAAVDIVRSRDMVMVWAAGNEGWNSVNGQIDLVQCTSGAERRPKNCKGRTLRVSQSQFVSGFNSTNYMDDSGNPRTGKGRISSVPYISLPDLPNLRASSPLWAVGNIEQHFADLQRGRITSRRFAEIITADPYVSQSLFRWLAVVATDRSGSIASYSNGCGLSAAWCLSAPGSGIYTADSDSDSDYATSSGTSFAAPHVSGALAVLKSRMPVMPMSVIVAIVLTTATDLAPGGERIDGTYGWGLLNLDEAIKLQERVRVGTSASSLPPLQSAQLELPPAFAHIKKRLGGIQTAVGGIGDAYFNIALGDIATIQDTEKTMDADAAADMLARPEDSHAAAGILFAALARKSGKVRYAGADVGGWRLRHDFCDDCKLSKWREWDEWEGGGGRASPFFAKDKSGFVLQKRGGGWRPFAAAGGKADGQGNAPWRQFGLRWRGGFGGLSVAAEGSRIDESKTFWGANFGALGAGRARTMQGKIALGGEMGGGWRGLASYQIARGRADIASGGLLNRMSGLRAEGWSAGLERRNIFGGGRLRMMLQQKTTIRRGRAVFGGAVAEGDFGRAFYGGKKQTLRRQSASVDLSAPSRPSLLVGYATSPQENFRWSLAAEHSPAVDKTALSARMEMDF